MTPEEETAIWNHIASGWDIESREWFEQRARPMGFAHPLEMAVYHMWKRCVKENPDFLRALPAPTPEASHR